MNNITATLGRKQFRQRIDEALTPYFESIGFEKVALKDEQKSPEIIRVEEAR